MLTQPVVDPQTASAEIDLGAFADNLQVLSDHVAPAELMVVVKADGYGHGMVECAQAARAAGVPWLGVATPSEALMLREAGDDGRLLAWLYGVEEDLSPLVAADVDVSVHSVAQVSDITAAAGTAERRARVHLKVDTGLTRNGSTLAEWPAVCAAAAEAVTSGAVEVVGLWSHFAAADEPGAASVGQQLDAFRGAEEIARTAGLRPQLRHLGNSAAALIVPEAHFDLVRVGIAAYGVDPAPGVAALAGVPLRPVMRLRAQLAHVKDIEPDTGVSYGLTWTAPTRTRVGLVPLGYADGVPRHASNRGCAFVDGRQVPIRGRVCMDQFVVELGPESSAEVGDEIVLFGSGEGGEPTAADWAKWCDTIGYEVVTRIGSRVPRVYLRGNKNEAPSAVTVR
jgi:alanine racemase